MNTCTNTYSLKLEPWTTTNGLFTSSISTGRIQCEVLTTGRERLIRTRLIRSST